MSQEMCKAISCDSCNFAQTTLITSAQSKHEQLQKSFFEKYFQCVSKKQHIYKTPKTLIFLGFLFFFNYFQYPRF